MCIGETCVVLQQMLSNPKYKKPYKPCPHAYYHYEQVWVRVCDRCGKILESDVSESR